MARRPWGPDVSHFQGTVDWARVAKAGASFAAVKATEGSGYVDPTLKRNWPAMYRAGIKYRIAYHYAHIEGDPVIQARHFVDAVKAAGKIGRRDFLALDAEDVCPASKRIGSFATAAWCKKFVDEVVRYAGIPARRVIVYTGMWWWNPRAGGSALVADYPLWLSAYVDEARLRWFPWRTWRFWQYTSSGNVPGINGKADVNVFNGGPTGLAWITRPSVRRKAT